MKLGEHRPVFVLINPNISNLMVPISMRVEKHRTMLTQISGCCLGDEMCIAVLPSVNNTTHRKCL